MDFSSVVFFEFEALRLLNLESTKHTFRTKKGTMKDPNLSVAELRYQNTFQNHVPKMHSLITFLKFLSESLSRITFLTYIPHSRSQIRFQITFPNTFPNYVPQIRRSPNDAPKMRFLITFIKCVSQARSPNTAFS